MWLTHWKSPSVLLTPLFFLLSTGIQADTVLARCPLTAPFWDSLFLYMGQVISPFLFTFPCLCHAFHHQILFFIFNQPRCFLTPYLSFCPTTQLGISIKWNLPVAYTNTVCALFKWFVIVPPIFTRALSGLPFHFQKVHVVVEQMEADRHAFWVEKK